MGGGRRARRLHRRRRAQARPARARGLAAAGARPLIELAHRPVTLPLETPFRISRGAVDEYHVVEVSLTHDGVTGYGEATPDDRFGQTPATAAAFLDGVQLPGESGLRIDLGSSESAACAAVSAAFHDLVGKRAGKPLWKMIGTTPGGPPTVWTVVLDSPDAMARDAATRGAGFKALKLKLGGRDGLDVERVSAVREAVEIPLQVDVNEGWSFDEALDNIAALAAMGVTFVEQPLPAGDPDGPRLKGRARLPVVVDEDCHTLADVRPCADRAHGINIKLAKCGGIQEALEMIRAARELDLFVMLGCMGESSLGLAPACAIASLCDHVDLDGNLPLSADPWKGVDLIDGVQVVSDRPGLGVTRR